MSEFVPRLLPNAVRQLKKLAPPVARRLAERVSWLAQHLSEIKPEALKGDLAGLFRYRDGDYRIIYQPIQKERILVIHEIGHRREIYKKGK